jgi:hypothetical protein
MDTDEHGLMKLQIPSSNIQRSTNDQAPTLRTGGNLELGISLELGGWNLEVFFIRVHPCPSVVKSFPVRV